MVKISAILLSKNVAGEIIPALKSVYFVDEVILVDTGSTDETIRVSKPYVSKIVRTSGHNFSKWRNIGAKEASGDWLLYLDSDERITPKLRKEILSSVKDQSFSAYTIPRYEIFLGKHLEHWGDPRVLRLINKKKLVKWTGKIHEQPQIKGKIGQLSNYMLHLSHKNMDEKVLNTLNWANIEAQYMIDAQHPPMNGVRFFSAIIREFIYRFIKQGLWRDGTEGIIEVIYQMFSKFISYAKLWQLQRQPSLEETYKQIDEKLLKEINQSK